VFLNPPDANKYPKCAKWMSALEQRVKSTPKLLNAFIQACVADDQFKSTPAQVERIARRALAWAAPPRIEVYDDGLLTVPEAGVPVLACGYTNVLEIAFGRKPFLLITSIWFDAVEFGNPDEQSKNVERLTRTLLHEAVHWVRNEAGASDSILVGGYKGQYKEAGRTFEEWAYGSPNVCTKENIEDAIFSIQK